MKSFRIIKRFTHSHSPSKFPQSNCNNLTKEDLLEIEKKLEFIAHQTHINKYISITSFFLTVINLPFK
jgi:hypothetical protein